ncbi:MAG: septum formation inhibitor Maf [Microbacteriaceae bacterium]|nr:MAG: septum formation inhibitor Maf [Microbacteriaceae bacterium]
MRLYLASTSPARLALLRAAGVEPVVVPSHVDEPAAVVAAEAAAGKPLTPSELVQLLARAKAEAVAELLVDGAPIDGLILGGDSAFELDGVIYGKPHRPDVARERWQQQRGRTGLLHSGHWLIDHTDPAAGRPGTERRGAGPAGGRRAVGAVANASVTFAGDVTNDEIDAYVASGEPLAVAGAFTIDSLGGPFITNVDGDPSTVVGLSLSTLRRLVRELGHDWTSLWNRL